MKNYTYLLVLAAALAGCGKNVGYYADGGELVIAAPNLKADGKNNLDYPLSCAGANFVAEDPNVGLAAQADKEVVFDDDFKYRLNPNRTSDYACVIRDRSGKVVATQITVQGPGNPVLIYATPLSGFVDGNAFQWRTCEPDSFGCNDDGIIALGVTSPTGSTTPTETTPFGLIVTSQANAITAMVLDIHIGNAVTIPSVFMQIGGRVTEQVECSAGQEYNVAISARYSTNNQSVINNCDMLSNQKLYAQFAGGTIMLGNSCDLATNQITFIAQCDGTTLKAIGTNMTFDGVETPPDNDLDDDGYPNPNAADDCNDNNAAIHPGATEIPNDGIDENCNGNADEGVVVGGTDADNDGYCTGIGICVNTGDIAGDCDDTNVNIHPGVAEITGDGVDQNCNGNGDEGAIVGGPDADNDGYCTGNGVCVNVGDVPGDCNDSNANVHPLATEINNGIDDNCDGQIDESPPPVPTTSQTYMAMTATTTLEIHLLHAATQNVSSALYTETWTPGAPNKFRNTTYTMTKNVKIVYNPISNGSWCSDADFTGSANCKLYIKLDNNFACKLTQASFAIANGTTNPGSPAGASHHEAIINGLDNDLDGWIDTNIRVTNLAGQVVCSN